MKTAHKYIIQASLAGAFSVFLLTTMAGLSAEQLGVAVNYTYRHVLPQISSDGIP